MQAAYLDLLEEDPFADRSEVIDRLGSAYHELTGEALALEILHHLYRFSTLVDECIGMDEGV